MNSQNIILLKNDNINRKLLFKPLFTNKNYISMFFIFKTDYDVLTVNNYFSKTNIDYNYYKYNGTRLISFFVKKKLKQPKNNIQNILKNSTIKLINKLTDNIYLSKELIFTNKHDVSYLIISVSNDPLSTINLFTKIFNNNTKLSKYLGFDSINILENNVYSNEPIINRYERLGYLNIYFTNALEKYKKKELFKLKIIIEILTIISDLIFPNFKFALWIPLYSEENNFDFILQIHLHCGSNIEDLNDFDKYEFLDKYFSLIDKKIIKFREMFNKVKNENILKNIYNFEMDQLKKCNNMYIDEEFIYLIYRKFTKEYELNNLNNLNGFSNSDNLNNSNKCNKSDKCNKFENVDNSEKCNKSNNFNKLDNYNNIDNWENICEKYINLKKDTVNNVIFDDLYKLVYRLKNSNFITLEDN